MQRTDYAERFLEQMASVPLTWENVFRSPQYTGSLDREVVDLLLLLRNRGILVSLKCQQEPEKRAGAALARWVRKSVRSASKQLSGAIKTCRTRDFWCTHERRGRVTFGAGEIEPAEAIVLVETMERVSLDQDVRLEIDSSRFLTFLERLSERST